MNTPDVQTFLDRLDPARARVSAGRLDYARLGWLARQWWSEDRDNDPRATFDTMIEAYALAFSLDTKMVSEALRAQTEHLESRKRP